MEAQNKKERRASIIKFSVLFAITTAVILGATYFDFNRMPLKENKVLKPSSVLALLCADQATVHKDAVETGSINGSKLDFILLARAVESRRCTRPTSDMNKIAR